MSYELRKMKIMKGMKKHSPLGVASTLRRTESKAPALRLLFCKAGALPLTRRSVDATPSGDKAGIYPGENENENE
jgi:hypothetical protein